MNLEKLFGSKTKSDILKYLVFRRQGVSIRALESELGRTFPGIKKQIDSLEEAEILHIDKTPEKWAIKITDDLYEDIRRLIISSLKHDLMKLLADRTFIVNKYYFGKIFDVPIEVDLVILYSSETNSNQQPSNDRTLDSLKHAITNLFKLYMIDPAYLVFMEKQEFDKRSKMADKFALSLIRSNQ